MKLINGFLFFLALMLLISYFIVSAIASFYAITQGWGLSILVMYVVVCIINLFIATFIKLKFKTPDLNKSLTVITIVISVILILLSMKSMVGVNAEIELYNTIKKFLN